MKFGDARPLDAGAVREGKWFDLATAPGVRVRLRYYGNRNAEAARRQQLLVLRAKFPAEWGAFIKGEKSEEVARFAEELEAQVDAEHVLVDWEGVTGDEGEPVAYLPELGAELLSDPRWELVRQEVQSLANYLPHFRELAVEAAEAKDVGNGSAGGSGTGKNSRTRSRKSGSESGSRQSS